MRGDGFKLFNGIRASARTATRAARRRIRVSQRAGTRYIITENHILSAAAPTPMSNSQSLKSIGLKATFPRLKILELFESTEVRHLTAEDVYRMLIAEGMDIGLATVYRVLTQFEQAGILERHYFESGKAVFELNAGKHHDHLVCVNCGRVEEFYDAEIERRQNKIAKERGFAIQEHALYLYVECLKPDCPHRSKETKARNG